MNRMKSSMLGLLGAMLLSDRVSMNDYDIQGTNDLTPDKIRLNKNKIIPKGCKEYTFEDGFKCIASSQKKADKKHLKYLNK